MGLWAAMLVVPLAFMAMSRAVASGPSTPELTGLFFWIAVGASAFAIALSRVLPPRLGVSRAGPEATILSRLVVAWALCEAAILFPLVAHLLTGDLRLLGVFAVDMIALVLLYPSDLYIQSLAPSEDEQTRARGGPA
jgi:hypothetical protein